MLNSSKEEEAERWPSRMSPDSMPRVALHDPAKKERRSERKDGGGGGGSALVYCSIVQGGREGQGRHCRPEAVVVVGQAGSS